MGWGPAHSICNLQLDVPNEILVVFYNESKYHFHFIVKELANQFEGQFIGENNENYKSFFCSYKKGDYKN